MNSLELEKIQVIFLTHQNWNQLHSLPTRSLCHLPHPSPISPASVMAMVLLLPPTPKLSHLRTFALAVSSAILWLFKWQAPSPFKFK